jgi:hypothetical protein
VDITGADTNCSILLAGGSGSCSVSFSSTGTKLLVASYIGDGNYAPSSGTTSHVVNKGSTTTTITADTPDPSAPTQAFTVSVNVIGAGATPTGTVDITGADINCTITLSGGNGSCGTVVFNTIGAVKVLTANYNGDGNYLSSMDTENHAVFNASTTIITSDILDPSTPGGIVAVQFTVSGPGGTPTGLVTITGADVNCAPVLLVAGSGTCNVTFNTAGAKVLTATYPGDGSFTASSGTATHTVDRGASVTTIITDLPDPSLPFESVAVAVSVTGLGVTPTGSVGISISGGVPSTCNLTLVGGLGTCNVVFNISGTFTITATYSGDGNYLPSLATTAHVVSP